MDRVRVELWDRRRRVRCHLIVMAREACPGEGRGPAIHVFATASARKTWMPTCVGMTLWSGGSQPSRREDAVNGPGSAVPWAHVIQ